MSRTTLARATMIALLAVGMSSAMAAGKAKSSTTTTMNDDIYAD